MSIGEVPATMNSLSESGWIDGELFDLWSRHYFLCHSPPLHPLVLLLDGHSYHYTPSVINKAVEKGIITFCLLLHLIEPLDKGCFFILRRYWREEYDN